MKMPNESNKKATTIGAKMPEKSPETYSLITYAWVFGISAAGGAVAFIRKMRLGHARAFNVAEFVGECTTSAFAGVITFYLCEASGFNQLLTASLVGIAGHMGSRALHNLELFFGAKFPIPKQTKDDQDGQE